MAHARQDLVSMLLMDHEEVKAQFTRLIGADENARDEMFCELRSMLVRHEVAEEEVVYPEVRRELTDGNQLADARIAEQSEAEELLASIERAGVEDPAFLSTIEALRTAVLNHAQMEEQTVFVPLNTTLDADKKEKLGQRYEKAKAAAPTHPHPHAPNTPPGNLVAGPVAALIDRTRDAMHRAAS